MRELDLSFDHKPHVLAQIYLEIMLKNSLIYRFAKMSLDLLSGLSA